MCVDFREAAPPTASRLNRSASNATSPVDKPQEAMPWLKVLLTRAIYFVVVFFSIMRYVLDSSPVTGDKICGAIAAYLVMGIAWTFVYSLFYHLDPTSFDVPEALLAHTTINSTWTMWH